MIESICHFQNLLSLLFAKRYIRHLHSKPHVNTKRVKNEPFFIMICVKPFITDRTMETLRNEFHFSEVY